MSKHTHNIELPSSHFSLYRCPSLSHLGLHLSLVGRTIERLNGWALHGPGRTGEFSYAHKHNSANISAQHAMQQPNLCPFNVTNKKQNIDLYFVLFFFALLLHRSTHKIWNKSKWNVQPATALFHRYIYIVHTFRITFYISLLLLLLRPLPFTIITVIVSNIVRGNFTINKRKINK